MRKSLRFFIVSLSLFLPSFMALADDSGAEISPAVYASQEAATSAVNYGQTLCNTPGYYCRRVTSKDTWYTLFPDYVQREEVMRLNRTNVALMYRNWIVVPKDFSKTTYMDMSPLPKKINTHGENEVFINLSLFAFGAYDKNGDLVYWGPISSGRNQCFDDTNGSCATVTGKFRIFRIGGKDCASNEFPLETHGGAPMPYCMFFHGGTAFHTSTLSGFINRSSGCVRMFNSDAEWLNQRFVKLGTLVVVTR